MNESIELKDREIIDILPHPGLPIRSFGVALNTDEAQSFIEKDYRVFGDEEGPYLVVRLRGNQFWPLVMNKRKADVTFEPLPWILNNNETGVICWLTKIL